MEEKRHNVRLMFRTKLRVERNIAQKNVLFEGVLKNIGKRGFAFMSEDKIQRGLAYRFEIDVLGSNLTVVGRVVHMHELATYFVYGIKIESIALFDRIRFNQFLANRDTMTKVRFFVFSVVMGGLAALIGRYVFDASQLVTLCLFFITTIFHLAFPPY